MSKIKAPKKLTQAVCKNLIGHFLRVKQGNKIDVMLAVDYCEVVDFGRTYYELHCFSLSKKAVFPVEARQIQAVGAQPKQFNWVVEPFGSSE